MNGNLNVGQQLSLTKKFAKALVSATIVGTLAFGAMTFTDTPSIAGGETRTISMYHVHTGESLTVTYMQGGRYVPSAMKKLNYLLRDWRRNEVITVDPKTIDLLWELHADLGSKAPIKIVCGYRSPKTNAFLRRIGRKVAGKSQHMKGKAIDFFFPDVSLIKIRNSALARQVGGVGFYRGRNGFLHADSGNVRHWGGGGISRSQMASIISEGRRTMGRRLNRNDMAGVADVASKEKPSSIWSLFTRGKKSGKGQSPAVVDDGNDEPPALETAYTAEDGELANLSADAATAEAAAAKKAALKLVPPTPVAEAVAEPEFIDPPVVKPAKKPLPMVANSELAALASSASVESQAEQPAQQVALLVPKPRLKPRVVFAMAAAKQKEDEVNIQPASAAPEVTWKVKKPSPLATANASDSLGTIPEASGMIIDGADIAGTSDDVNLDGKTSLTADLGDVPTSDVVVIRPIVASLEGNEPSWWSLLYSNAEASATRSGMPPLLDDAKSDVMPVAVNLGPDGTGPAASLRLQVAADGKSDMQEVDREGKGSLPAKVLRLSSSNE